MKIILCTTPIRPVPTEFPPIACTSLIEVLRASGRNPSFYDIDAIRPKFEEVVAYFEREKPDLLGISAVVSTSYRYVRDLTHAVKRISPKTKIILGGNLAASSEILLRKCPIDLTVVGEGEKTMLNLTKYLEEHGDFRPNEALQQIKGIAFLNDAKEMIFTGYETPIPGRELRQFNYEILEEFSRLDRFISDPFSNPCYINDARTFEPHRKQMKQASIRASKGCVARCTFCHRWDKGYRVHDVDDLVATFKHYKEKWNVGFFSIVDENFGSDIEALRDFAEKIRPLDIIFRVAGVRVSTVDRNPDIIRVLQEAGCAAMIFGMESGSPKMLSVMEKGATLEQNRRVMQMLKEEKMYTVVQLVVGMPGENDETIKESAEFAKFATEDMDDLPYERLSVNFFQALPGTPGYEFAREKGVIGPTIDDEEQYLLNISDVDASDWLNYLNVSEVDRARALLWSGRIVDEAHINFYKKRGWRRFVPNERVKQGRVKDYARGGYFRIRGRNKGAAYWWLRDKMRPLFSILLLFRTRAHIYGTKKAIGLFLGLVKEQNRSKFLVQEPQSLRKVVKYPKPEELSVTEASMLPLRMGR